MKKLTIGEMKKIAQERNGDCLSSEYVDIFTPLQWKCHLGHIWEAKPCHVRYGSWCHKCWQKSIHPTKYTIEDAKQHALARQGECLSTTLNRKSDRLLWKCKLGHRWEAKFEDMTRIRNGKPVQGWCHECAVLERTHSLSEVQEIAAKYKGKCASNLYVDCSQLLEWECEEGHKWQASLNNVKNNHSWCPYCATSRGERNFRKILEKVTGLEFIRSRPEWLRNSEGNRLELDGYNEKTKIAFEFQGMQHCGYLPHFHKSYDAYKKIVEHDEIKIIECQKRGILLLTPTSRIKEEKYEEYIKDRLKGKII